MKDLLNKNNCYWRLIQINPLDIVTKIERWSGVNNCKFVSISRCKFIHIYKKSETLE